MECALEKLMRNLLIILLLQDYVSYNVALCAKLVFRKMNNCGANQLLGGLMFIGRG